MMNGNTQVVTIFGFGSLMDVQSARKTMPSATNFRKGCVKVLLLTLTHSLTHSLLPGHA